jgi:hypothetical protein
MTARSPESKINAELEKKKTVVQYSIQLSHKKKISEKT